MGYLLTDIIKILFQRVSVERILSKDSTKAVIFNRFEFDYIQELMITYNHNFSETEIRLKINEMYMRRKRLKKSSIDYPSNKFDVFDILFSFVNDLLIFNENKVMCKYSELDEWNTLRRAIGEDLPIMAMIAQRDAEHGKQYHTFSMPMVIEHNNIQLKRILDKGMAENHFHLRGSAPLFHISWINLMNRPYQGKYLNGIKGFEKDLRDKNKKVEFGLTRLSLADMVVCAAIIRLYLSSQLFGIKLQFDIYKIDLKRLVRYMDDDIYKMSDLWNVYWKKRQPTPGDFAYIRDIVDYIDFYIAENVWFEKEILFLSLFSSTEIQLEESFDKIIKQIVEKNSSIPLKECKELLGEDRFSRLWNEATEQTIDRMLDSIIHGNKNYPIIESLIDVIQYRNDYMDYMLEFAPKDYLEGEKDFWMLSGERWFLYSVLKEVYVGSRILNEKDCNLFYAYLRIKNEIRLELEQSNELIGFENFQKYQNRKDIFTHRTNFLQSETVLARLAVRDILKNPSIKYLEARIMVADTPEANLRNIKGYDNAILEQKYDVIRNKIISDDEIKNRFYYVLEFPKREDKDKGYKYFPEYRHYNFRKYVRDRAESLIAFRNNYPEYGKRVLGIGACSQEIGCRPEIFATAFRMLTKHPIEVNQVSSKIILPQLRITYHVGEDFLDIVDGLRAIEEAVRFFEMDCGDRLGHAIALGTDVGEWYLKKNNMITIQLQDYLDNVVWLHHVLIKANKSEVRTLIGWLEEQYSYYFSYIYQKSLIPRKKKQNRKDFSEYEEGSQDSVQLFEGNFDINTYYLSWLLRGDDPELYKSGKYTPAPNGVDPWNHYSTNRKQIQRDDIREIPEVSYMYYLYHYNSRVKEQGNIIRTITVPPMYIEGVKCAQEYMQELLVSRGISIETNPSSNMLIGDISDGSKHPIKVFYNKGLVKNEQELMKCPQMNVSINTDDRGVFATRLENEYALLAYAYEQAKDELQRPIYKKDFIYEWLDNIRDMGLRQSFVHDIENNKDLESV